MASLNKVILIGHIGQKPEIVETKTGKKIAKFSLATSQKVKDRDGDYKQETQWHSVIVLNENLTSIIGDYVKKGSKVYLEGQLKYESYEDKEGNTKTSTKILISGFNSQLILLDSKEQEKTQKTTESRSEKINEKMYGNSPSYLDDEVPF